MLQFGHCVVSSSVPAATNIPRQPSRVRQRRGVPKPTWCDVVLLRCVDAVAAELSRARSLALRASATPIHDCGCTHRLADASIGSSLAKSPHWRGKRRAKRQAAANIDLRTRQPALAAQGRSA